MKTFVKLLTVFLLSLGGNTAFALLGDDIPVVEDMPTEETASAPTIILSGYSTAPAKWTIGVTRGIMSSTSVHRIEYGKATYTSIDLPEGLVMEPSSGFIYGITYAPSGTYYISIRITNSKGSLFIKASDQIYKLLVQEQSEDYTRVGWDVVPIGKVGDTFDITPPTEQYDRVITGIWSIVDGAPAIFTTNLSNMSLTLVEPGIGVGYTAFTYGGKYVAVYGSQILCLPEGYDENLVQYDESTGNIVDADGNILVYGTPEDDTDTGDTGTTIVVSDETPVMAFAATQEVTSDNEEVVADLEVTAPAVATPTVADVLRGNVTQFNYDLYVMLEIGDGVLFITDTGTSKDLTGDTKEFTKKIKSGKHRIFDLQMTPVLRLALKGVKIKWYAGCVSDEMEVCGGIATATTEFK